MHGNQTVAQLISQPAEPFDAIRAAEKTDELCLTVWLPAIMVKKKRKVDYMTFFHTVAATRSRRLIIDYHFTVVAKKKKKIIMHFWLKGRGHTVNSSPACCLPCYHDSLTGESSSSPFMVRRQRPDTSKIWASLPDFPYTVYVILFWKHCVLMICNPSNIR